MVSGIGDKRALDFFERNGLPEDFTHTMASMFLTFPEQSRYLVLSKAWNRRIKAIFEQEPMKEYVSLLRQRPLRVKMAPININVTNTGLKIKHQTSRFLILDPVKRELDIGTRHSGAVLLQKDCPERVEKLQPFIKVWHCIEDDIFYSRDCDSWGGDLPAARLYHTKVQDWDSPHKHNLITTLSTIDDEENKDSNSLSVWLRMDNGDHIIIGVQGDLHHLDQNRNPITQTFQVFPQLPQGTKGYIIQAQIVNGFLVINAEIERDLTNLQRIIEVRSVKDLRTVVNRLSFSRALHLNFTKTQIVVRYLEQSEWLLKWLLNCFDVPSLKPIHNEPLQMDLDTDRGGVANNRWAVWQISNKNGSQDGFYVVDLVSKKTFQHTEPACTMHLKGDLLLYCPTQDLCPSNQVKVLNLKDRIHVLTLAYTAFTQTPRTILIGKNEISACVRERDPSTGNLGDYYLTTLSLECLRSKKKTEGEVKVAAEEGERKAVVASASAGSAGAGAGASSTDNASDIDLSKGLT